MSHLEIKKDILSLNRPEVEFISGMPLLPKNGEGMFAYIFKTLSKHLTIGVLTDQAALAFYNRYHSNWVQGYLSFNHSA